MPVRNIGRNSDRLKLKFPIVKNFVYIDIVKGKETLLSFKKEDLKKIGEVTWREFQFIVQDKLDSKYGEKYPAGKFNYVCMQENSTLVERGIIKTISRKSFLDSPVENKNKAIEMNELIELKKELQSLKSNDISTETLLALTRQGYEIQINFKDEQLKSKDEIIKRLNVDIDKLNDELDKYEDIVEDLKSKSGMNQLIELGQKMLYAKFGKASEVTNLSASNTSDIPEEILQILGLVDYSQIPPDQMQKITSGLRQYISILPLKT